MTFEHGARRCRAHFYRQHHREIVNNEHHVFWAPATIDGGGFACFAAENFVGHSLSTRTEMAGIIDMS